MTNEQIEEWKADRLATMAEIESCEKAGKEVPVDLMIHAAVLVAVRPPGWTVRYDDWETEH
jgi:hypothetical protein